ncbi:hypothetical protein JOQ06_006346, partial [Pogonophryne albipinna]
MFITPLRSSATAFRDVQVSERASPGEADPRADPGPEGAGLHLERLIPEQILVLKGLHLMRLIPEQILVLKGRGFTWGGASPDEADPRAVPGEASLDRNKLSLELKALRQDLYKMELNIKWPQDRISAEWIWILNGDDLQLTSSWSSDPPLLITLDSVAAECRPERHGGHSTPEALANTSSLFDRKQTEAALHVKDSHLQASCVPDPISCEGRSAERAGQTEHGTLEDMKVGLIRRKTLLCQTEHGTFEDWKL